MGWLQNLRLECLERKPALIRCICDDDDVYDDKNVMMMRKMIAMMMIMMMQWLFGSSPWKDQ